MLVDYIPHQLQVKPEADAFIFVGADKIAKSEIKPWAFIYYVSYSLGQSKSFFCIKSMLISFKISI